MVGVAQQVARQRAAAACAFPGLFRNERSSGGFPVKAFALTHRLSGIALALFLPLHFWALGQALEGEAKLESFLRWTDQPLVKASEWAIVLLLAVHLTGGVRILMIEFLPCRDWQRLLAAAAAATALSLGLLF